MTESTSINEAHALDKLKLTILAENLTQISRIGNLWYTKNLTGQREYANASLHFLRKKRKERREGKN